MSFSLPQTNRMEGWQLQKCSNMAHIIQIVVGFFIFGLGLSNTVVLANGSNNNFSIIDEHQTCDLIIPKFVEQIMSQKAPSCGEAGVFPQPGNCSMFFKCVQSDTVIQPYIEYCSAGYIFVNKVCVPNTNSSDCPQYTCRIPDGTHAIGNEIISDDEVNIENNFQSQPFVSSTSPAPEEAHTVDNRDRGTKAMEAEISDNTVQQEDQAEQLQMTMTQAQGQDKSSGSTFIHDHFIISFSIFFLFSNMQ